MRRRYKPHIAFKYEPKPFAGASWQAWWFPPLDDSILGFICITFGDNPSEALAKLMPRNRA